MNRGQRLLMAQRPGAPLGPPPVRLSPEQVQAWHDILAASPDVYRRPDAMWLELCASSLASWRKVLQAYAFNPALCGSREQMRAHVRFCYRVLGDGFMRMSERRRLLFPERP